MADSPFDRDDPDTGSMFDFLDEEASGRARATGEKVASAVSPGARRSMPIIRKPVPVSRSGPILAPGLEKPMPEADADEFDFLNEVRALDDPDQASAALPGDFEPTSTIDADPDWLPDDDQWPPSFTPRDSEEDSMSGTPGLLRRSALLFAVLLVACGGVLFLYDELPLGDWLSGDESIVAVDEASGEGSGTVDAAVDVDATVDSVDVASIDTVAPAARTPRAGSLAARFNAAIEQIELLVDSGELDAAQVQIDTLDRSVYGYGRPEFTAFEQRIVSQQNENERLAEAQRVADAEREAEAERVAEAERAAEAARLAEAERQAEAERLAEAARQAEEAERLAALERAAEAERQAEAARVATAERAAEAERRAEEARLAEVARVAEAERLAEVARVAAAERAAEAARQAEVARVTEAERLAEAERQAEAARLAETEQAAESERLAAAERAGQDAGRDPVAGGNASDSAWVADAEATNALISATAGSTPEQQAVALEAAREAARIAAQQRSSEIARQRQSATANAPDEANGVSTAPSQRAADRRATTLAADRAATDRRVAEQRERAQQTALREAADAAIAADSASTVTGRVAADAADTQRATPAAQRIETAALTRAPEQSSRSVIGDEDLQYVYGRFVELENAVERRDIQSVIALTRPSGARIQQLLQVFENSESLEARITNVSMRKADAEITGMLRIDSIRRGDGSRVRPPPGLEAVALSSTRSDSGWSALIW